MDPLKCSPFRRGELEHAFGLTRRVCVLEERLQLGGPMFVVWKHHGQVLLADDLLGVIPVHPVRAFVPGHHTSVEVDRDDGVFSGGIEHTAQEQRALRQLFGLPPDFLRFPEQLDEDRDLRPQDLRFEGLEDVIDGAQRVAAGDVGLALDGRGEEDDRRVARLLPVADERGGLEAVHAGHVHVQEDDREVLLEQMHQRLRAGAGVPQRPPFTREHGFQREQVLRFVVDEQDLDQR